MVLVADAHRDRARDAVDPQQQDVKRVTALPGEALLGVVRSPDVIRREAVEGAAVVDRDVVGHFGPGAQANPVRLGDAAVLEQRLRRRLLVGPDTLLESAAQLRVVRFTDEVVPLVIEGRVEEEALVLEFEVLVLLADAALAQSEQLLALRESADRYCPFLESDWHVKSVPAEGGESEEIRGRAAPPGRERPSACPRSRILDEQVQIAKLKIAKLMAAAAWGLDSKAVSWP